MRASEYVHRWTLPYDRPIPKTPIPLEVLLREHLAHRYDLQEVTVLPSPVSHCSVIETTHTAHAFSSEYENTLQPTTHPDQHPRCHESDVRSTLPYPMSVFLFVSETFR